MTRQLMMDVFGKKMFPSMNPMTAIYGYAEGVAVVNDDVARPAPHFTGPQCGSCEFLVYHQRNRRYYKCEKRGITNGPGTDHRVRWPACGLYQQRQSSAT